MSEPRSRVRKPDAQTAEEENIVTKEVEKTEEVVNDEAKQNDFAADQAKEKEEVQPTSLNLPLRREGFHLVDASGRRVAMCGVEGDMVRTGPGIAEALIQALNK